VKDEIAKLMWRWFEEQANEVLEFVGVEASDAIDFDTLVFAMWVGWKHGFVDGREPDDD